MHNLPTYPIAAWYYLGINRDPCQMIDTWHDLGLNVVTLAYSLTQKELLLRALDRAEEVGMKLILMDPRTSFHVFHQKGEDAYRAGLREAIADFGSHPAVFGFDIGDEPDAPYFDAAVGALRVNGEEAPHLNAFLNILPWFDGVEERIGSTALAPYLDRICREAKPHLIGYDCYAHMKTHVDDRDTYFNNLREHMLSHKRNGVPYMCTVLCADHFFYRRATKDYLRWQLSTAAAHGAGGVMWFHIELDPRDQDYRDAPINRLGDRTEVFGWMREVNLEFQNRFGTILPRLTIDQCYHVGKAWGGLPLFEPFGGIRHISAGEPLVVSSFRDGDGQIYYAVCSNSPEKPAYVDLKTAEGVAFERCGWGGTFSPMHGYTDAVGQGMGKEGQTYGFFLAPGQMQLFKEVRK